MTLYRHVITNDPQDLGLITTDSAVEYVEYNMTVPELVQHYLDQIAPGMIESNRTNISIFNYHSRLGTPEIMRSTCGPELPDGDGKEDLFKHLYNLLDTFKATTGIPGEGIFRLDHPPTHDLGEWHQDEGIELYTAISSLTGERGTYRMLPQSPLRQEFNDKPRAYFPYKTGQDSDCAYMGIGNFGIWRTTSGCKRPGPQPETPPRTALVHSPTPGIVSTDPRFIWVISG